MGYGSHRAKYESQLAMAHRRLYNAQEAAWAMNDESAALDIDQLLSEVTRLCEDSLRGKPRKVHQVIPGQLAIPDAP